MPGVRDRLPFVGLRDAYQAQGRRMNYPPCSFAGSLIALAWLLGLGLSVRGWMVVAECCWTGKAQDGQDCYYYQYHYQEEYLRTLAFIFFSLKQWNHYPFWVEIWRFFCTDFSFHLPGCWKRIYPIRSFSCNETLEHFAQTNNFRKNQEKSMEHMLKNIPLGWWKELGYLYTLSIRQRAGSVLGG